MAEVTLENANRRARELFDKALASMERNNLDYAMDTFLRALELEPQLLKARKFLRAAEVKEFKAKKGGPITHAIATLRGIPLMLGVMSTTKKQPAKALLMAEKLLRIDPLNLTFINLFGQAAAAASMPEVALQTLEVAKEHYPKNLPLLRWMSSLYLQNNQPHEARLCMETVVQMTPNDPKAIKGLKDTVALDTMQKGGWDEKSSYRDKMKDSKEAVLLEQQNKAVKSSSDIDDLIRENEKKIEREPDNVNYRRTLADLYVRSGRMDDALKTLQESQRSAGRADPQVERAISVINVKKYDQEIEKLQAANDTEGAEAMRAKRRIFMLEDAADRAKRYPNDLQFRYELGVQLFEHNRINEAIEEFQLSQRNPQRRIRSLYYMAVCFKMKNQFDIAIEQLAKANSELTLMDETKKDILYEMGTLCEATGNKEKAVGYFKEIYSVDIKYKDIAAKIEHAYKK